MVQTNFLADFGLSFFYAMLSTLSLIAIAFGVIVVVSLLFLWVRYLLAVTRAAQVYVDLNGAEAARARAAAEAAAPAAAPAASKPRTSAAKTTTARTSAAKAAPATTSTAKTSTAKAAPNSAAPKSAAPKSAAKPATGRSGAAPKSPPRPKG